jgi:hypothetical protein
MNNIKILLNKLTKKNNNVVVLSMSDTFYYDIGMNVVGVDRIYCLTESASKLMVEVCIEGDYFVPRSFMLTNNNIEEVMNLIDQIYKTCITDRFQILISGNLDSTHPTNQICLSVLAFKELEI